MPSDRERHTAGASPAPHTRHRERADVRALVRRALRNDAQVPPRRGYALLMLRLFHGTIIFVSFFFVFSICHELKICRTLIYCGRDSACVGGCPYARDIQTDIRTSEIARERVCVCLSVGRNCEECILQCFCDGNVTASVVWERFMKGDGLNLFMAVPTVYGSNRLFIQLHHIYMHIIYFSFILYCSQ